MLATAIIAFREFLEAFLIVGVFLGVSQKLQLKKEFEILLAAALGVMVSFALAIATYLFGGHALSTLTERQTDFFESYLLIFSGVFIGYVVFSLHGAMSRSRTKMIADAKKRLEGRVFDLSLFATILFLILKEGFEVSLFTASVSLFSAFTQNILGLVLGFVAAGVVGISTFFAYTQFPVNRVFKTTEYLIILLGASLTELGITKLLQTHFSVNISNFISFHLQFLPNEDTFAGHALQALFGIDQEFSLARLAVMLAYIAVMYVLFKEKKRRKAP